MPLKKGTSQKVVSANIRELKSAGLTKYCPVCGKQFRVPPYREHRAVYCSRECQNHGQYEHIKKICLECGKVRMWERVPLRPLPWKKEKKVN